MHHRSKCGGDQFVSDRNGVDGTRTHLAMPSSVVTTPLKAERDFTPRCEVAEVCLDGTMLTKRSSFDRVNLRKDMYYTVDLILKQNILLGQLGSAVDDRDRRG